MSNVIKQATPASNPAPIAPPPTNQPVANDVVANLRAFFRNDMGFLPIIVVLVAITSFFEVTSGGSFFSSQNLTNLLLQTITTGTLAIGATLVLLLGEIDLSLAAVSGVCAAVVGVLVAQTGGDTSRGFGLDPWLAILGALIVGAIIGLVNGFFIAVLRVPAFIVTLSGSIAYAGLILVVLGPNGTLKINDNTINGIASNYLPNWLSIVVVAIVVLLYVASLFINRQSRLRVGLRARNPAQLALQAGLVVVVVAVVVLSLQSFNGVPVVGIILMGLVILFWLILTRTGFGRHVYAVGGNAEASRRAGINVTGVRIMIFVLASTLAAVSGILEASRERSVPAAVNPTLLLDAIAAAVIGGVSLFGGRGSVWAIVLGSLVVKSLENGLTLLGQSQEIVEIVQGAVLLLAVTLDALLRRGTAVRR